MSTEALLKQKVICCCGSGGVGKTTLSAALAYGAASRGRKAIVLTIDPAKRLATAMGIDSIDHTPRVIATNELKHLKLPKGASLSAMMLDTKRTFDRIIERYATDDAARERILTNPLYKHLSTMIAGSQEYMAMEKLYEIAEAGIYDTVVLDTPPTRHALDFLKAPEKMTRAITDSMLKLFIKPSLIAGGWSMGLMKRFGKMAGFQFIQELSDLMSSTVNLLGGFKDRADAVHKILRRETTSFVLVTTPTREKLGDAECFIEQLKDEGISTDMILVNRTHSSFYLPKSSLGKLESLKSDTKTKNLADALLFFHQVAASEKSAVTAFLKKRKEDITIKMLPNMQEDIHDLKGVAEMFEKIVLSDER